MQAIIATRSPSCTPIAELSTVPKPSPAPGHLLVQVKAIGLNLVDARYAYHPIATSPVRVVGSDFAGEVVELGEGTTGFKVGDRVAAFLHGACTPNDLPGAFAEFTTTPADLAFRIPSQISFEEAATVPLCALTAAQGLFERLNIPAPFPFPSSPLPLVDPHSLLLIYGASTVLGLYVLQLALLSPLPLNIICTASPRNHSLLLSLGASAVFDYRSPTWIEDVRGTTEGGKGVTVAFDCISEGSSVRDCSQCFGEQGGRMATVEKGWEREGLNENVELFPGLVWTGLGERVEYSSRPPLLPDPISRAFTTTFYTFLAPPGATHLAIKPAPVRHMPGGLERVIPDGFALLGSNHVTERTTGSEGTKGEEGMKPISAEKLVYRLG